MDIKILKPLVKSTPPKKAKFRFMIELDSIETYTEIPRL
jgi:hypothetical protein